jgi:calcineurin-like phosphoesterase family protein
MSNILISSDLHLGHKNVCRFRTQFETVEEHDEVIFDNLATALGKRDSLVLLGDVTFTQHWLDRIGELNCAKKTLVLGNHCTEYLSIHELVKVYDSIHGLWSKKHCWFSHCPMHYQEMRGKLLNIHGHLHFNNVWKNKEPEGFKFAPGNEPYMDELDVRYFNACLEHTEYKPITFSDIMDITGVMDG